MSRMHPGTSYRVVELMIATQLKGLGGRRNKECSSECRPVATGCQLRHGKMAPRSYGRLSPENRHIPYCVAAFPNLQTGTSQEGGEKNCE